MIFKRKLRENMKKKTYNNVLKAGKLIQKKGYSEEWINQRLKTIGAKQTMSI